MMIIKWFSTVTSQTIYYSLCLITRCTSFAFRPPSTSPPYWKAHNYTVTEIPAMNRRPKGNPNTSVSWQHGQRENRLQWQQCKEAIARWMSYFCLKQWDKYTKFSQACNKYNKVKDMHQIFFYILFKINMVTEQVAKCTKCDVLSFRWDNNKLYYI